MRFSWKASLIRVRKEAFRSIIVEISKLIENLILGLLYDLIQLLLICHFLSRTEPEGQWILGTIPSFLAQ